MTKKIIAIWAEDENRLIGANQIMPWHLPKELQHFKKTTLNQVIVMGRVTFDGMKRRLLPNRQTLILTRDNQLAFEGVQCLTSVEEVLAWFQEQDKTLFVTGGSRVYEAFRDYYDELIVTTIHGQFEGDTYFPDSLDFSLYEKYAEEFFEADEKNTHAFTVRKYRRK